VSNSSRQVAPNDRVLFDGDGRPVGYQVAADIPPAYFLDQRQRDYARALGGQDGLRIMSANPDFGGPGRNATPYLQGLLDAASAAYSATLGRVTLTIPPGVWEVTAIHPRPNVVVDWSGAIIRKREAPSSVLTNSLVRGTRALVGGTTYYGNFDNIKWVGGRWESNGFACPAHIFRVDEWRRSELIDVEVVHSPENQSWAFQICGRDLRIVNPRVLGGTLVFQDGLHLCYGRQIEVIGGYIECGDDIVALGNDLVDASQTHDDEALELVTVKGLRGKTEKGMAVKLYYGLDTQGFGGTNRRRVRNCDVHVVGESGLSRNGGVAILVPDADNATDPTVIQNCNISVNLQVGAGAAHDGVNAFGVHVVTGENINIDAKLRITDTEGASARFRPLAVEGGRNVRVKLATAGPSGRAILVSPKHSTTVCEEIRVEDGDFHAANVDALSGIDVLNAAGAALGPVRILNNTIRGIRSNSYGVLTGASGTVSVLDIKGNTFRQLNGVTTGRCYAAGGASFVGHLNFVGNDCTGFANVSLGSFNTSHASYFVRDNLGFKSKAGGTATITAAATTVSVSHGLDVRLAAATSAAIPQITVRPTNNPTNAITWALSVSADTGFTITSSGVPGASTATYAWSVDTGKKPV
jgi:hypothetical protein